MDIRGLTKNSENSSWASKIENGWDIIYIMSTDKSPTHVNFDTKYRVSLAAKDNWTRAGV